MGQVFVGEIGNGLCGKPFYNYVEKDIHNLIWPAPETKGGAERS